MNSETGEDDHSGMTISLQIPVREPKLFRHKATNGLLHFLSNHRFGEYTVSRLAEQTGYSTTTISDAVNVLEHNDLVESHHRGTSRLISINRDRLDVPDDPIMQIPQSEFHEPVRKIVDALTDGIDDVVAILLYGSVARGNADRRSDIDLWVLVNENRASAQRTATDIAQEFGNMYFNKNEERFDFHIDVEGVRSIPTYSEDIAKIINSGIPVHTTDNFRKAATIINNMVEDAIYE